jgi:hypothetical protein
MNLAPSKGEHDHSIPLPLRNQPPNVHPYRYPFSQITEIQRMVQELLEATIIHHITSPYSSCIVMVLKKQGTWCICPYFHALNKLTIKYKFPIPVIGDLLDAIQGDCVFTKFFLCFGYHQIWMKEADIPNTSFRTHESHYELLVIPFGLCNAPSTFQIRMKKTLKPYLRQLFLVFFE